MVASQETAADGSPARWRPISTAILGLMLVESVAFAVASIVHFGNAIVLGPIAIMDPFPGAAVPEAVIAVAVGVGSLSVLARWPARWGVALATTLFALLLTIYGLTVTVGSARTGDVVYHLSVLTLSVVIIALLLSPMGRHALSG